MSNLAPWPSAEESGPRTPTGRDGRTVFVVDGETRVRRTVARILAELELSVEALASGGELLARLPLARPGCVLLELGMPHMEGLALHEELRRRGDGSPVLFMSRDATVEAGVLAMKRGAVDFLRKPLAPRALLEGVRAALDADARRWAVEREQTAIRSRFATLTQREAEVFLRVVEGLANKEIAYQLGITEKTVKVHRARAMLKMECGSLPDAVRMVDRARIG